MEESNVVVSDLIAFLNASRTPFVQGGKEVVANRGFRPPIEEVEREASNLQAGKRYFFTRNHSTIVAFAIGKRYAAGNGFYIIGAHTDSPRLRLNPVSKVVRGGCLEVAIERDRGGEQNGRLGGVSDGVWSSFVGDDLVNENICPLYNEKCKPRIVLSCDSVTWDRQGLVFRRL